MRYLKMLGLATTAATALMAFLGASSASATTLDGLDGPLKTGTGIDLSMASPVRALFHVGSTVLDECAGGTIEAVTLNETGASIYLSIVKKDTTWSECTKTTNTLSGGEVSITWTSGSNGSVHASGFEVTINTIFGSCNYGFGTGRNLGTLVGGSSASLSISATLLKVSGNGTCPVEVTFTGFYNITRPTYVGVTA